VHTLDAAAHLANGIVSVSVFVKPVSVAAKLARSAASLSKRALDFAHFVCRRDVGVDGVRESNKKSKLPRIRG